MSRRSAIVSPASERMRPTMTETCLGAPTQRTATVVGGGVLVRECAHAYVRACVRACVRDVFAIYNDNILPRLIMIIIKIIIIHFIQIKHTDDFPSTGIPASNHYVSQWSIFFFCACLGQTIQIPWKFAQYL